MPGLWVDGRPLAAQIGYYSDCLTFICDRADAEPKTILFAHLHRERPAGRADGGDCAIGRYRRPGIGAVFQFRQFRRATKAAAGGFAATRRWPAGSPPPCFGRSATR